MLVVLHFHVLFPIAHETVMFQVFQLTALVIRGPATLGERFIINLDRVAIKENEVRGVLLCKQVFVQRPHFTHRSFFSESGLRMLSESVVINDFITSSSVYAPCSLVRTVCAGQVMSDLCACWDRVFLGRRTAKDTSQRWYYGGTSWSDTASRPGVRIPDVVEEGRVEYVPVASPALGTPGASKNRSSPRKWKRTISGSPVKLPRNFEISSPPATSQKRSLAEDPSFASNLATEASRGKSRRSGRNGRAAPVFQMDFPSRQSAVNCFSLFFLFVILAELPCLSY